MGTTTNGFPYPDPGNPFANGDLGIKALAEACEDDVKAWQAYDNGWNGTISTGLKEGLYRQAGKRVDFQLRLLTVAGTTYPAAGWTFALPVAERAVRWCFQGTVRDASAGAVYAIHAQRTAAGVITVFLDPTTAGGALRNMAAGTLPFVWASTDELCLHGTYEAA